MPSQVFLGCSGFAYSHWKEIFYPKNLPLKEWFSFYCQQFNSVELNVSFYRLPTAKVFANWRKKADQAHPPAGSFVFATKGWRWVYPAWPIFEVVTADFVYLRFHGRSSLYASCYSKKELKETAEKIKNWVKNGLDVYVYFNNDAMGYAIKNAKELKFILKHQETKI